MKRQFWASCVNWNKNVDLLEEIIESGKKISKSTFLKNCEVEDPIVRQSMKNFPNDYIFYKGSGKYKNIYWYTWSMIEYFYR